MRKMQRIAALGLAGTMALSLAACGGSASTAASTESTAASAAEATADSDLAYIKNKGKMTIGYTVYEPMNYTDADGNFTGFDTELATAVCEKLGVEYKIITNVPEGQECYNAAAELVDAGCNVVFADSFGHEDFMIQAAKEFKDVQFCHATGTSGKIANIENFHNAFASIYEGRYLAGIAAGMKLNEMIENGEFTADEAKMGYCLLYTSPSPRDRG